MTVSEERRAALRGFFEMTQRGENRGVTFVEVSDILGVLDDLDAAERALGEVDAIVDGALVCPVCTHSACAALVQIAGVLAQASTDSPTTAELRHGTDRRAAFRRPRRRGVSHLRGGDRVPARSEVRDGPSPGLPAGGVLMRPPDGVGRCAACPLQAALWAGLCWSCSTARAKGQAA